PRRRPRQPTTTSRRTGPRRSADRMSEQSDRTLRTVDPAPVPATPRQRSGGRRPPGRRRWRDLIGVVPFFAVVTLFVVIGSFTGDDGPTLDNLTALADGYILDAFVRSIVLSTVTALLGAVF